MKMKIWGRDLEVDIHYEAYAGDIVLECQKNALEKFVDCVDRILTSDDLVKKYINSDQYKQIDESVVNVFQYVKPTHLFIKRNSDKRVVALMCDYRFDMEHGIAIVFENEKFVNIVPQDSLY